MAEAAAGGVQQTSNDRSWIVAVVASVVAVGLQLWGVYRVQSPPNWAWFPHADKFEHAGGFALPVLTILLAGWLRGRSLGRALRRTAVVVVAAIFAAHAVVSELIQHFFYRTRTGDPTDAAADGVGIVMGLGVFQLIRRRVERRTPT